MCCQLACTGIWRHEQAEGSRGTCTGRGVAQPGALVPAQPARRALAGAPTHVLPPVCSAGSWRAATLHSCSTPLPSSSTSAPGCGTPHPRRPACPEPRALAGFSGEPKCAGRMGSLQLPPRLASLAYARDRSHAHAALCADCATMPCSPQVSHILQLHAADGAAGGVLLGTRVAGARLPAHSSCCCCCCRCGVVGVGVGVGWYCWYCCCVCLQAWCCRLPACCASLLSAHTTRPRPRCVLQQPKRKRRLTALADQLSCALFGIANTVTALFFAIEKSTNVRGAQRCA